MTNRASIIIIWAAPGLLWKFPTKDFTTAIKDIANYWILLSFLFL